MRSLGRQRPSPEHRPHPLHMCELPECRGTKPEQYRCCPVQDLPDTGASVPHLRHGQDREFTAQRDLQMATPSRLECAASSCEPTPELGGGHNILCDRSCSFQEIPGYVAGPSTLVRGLALLGNRNRYGRFGARTQSLVLDTPGHAKRERFAQRAGIECPHDIGTVNVSRRPKSCARIPSPAWQPP